MAETRVYTESFEAFWMCYPKKIGKYKAFLAWKTHSKYMPPLADILFSVDQHKKSKQWQDEQYVCHATTFINQHRWEDELDMVSGAKKYKSYDEALADCAGQPRYESIGAGELILEGEIIGKR